MHNDSTSAQRQDSFYGRYISLLFLSFLIPVSCWGQLFADGAYTKPNLVVEAGQIFLVPSFNKMISVDSFVMKPGSKLIKSSQSQHTVIKDNELTIRANYFMMEAGATIDFSGKVNDPVTLISRFSGGYVPNCSDGGNGMDGRAGIDGNNGGWLKIFAKTVSIAPSRIILNGSNGSDGQDGTEGQDGGAANCNCDRAGNGGHGGIGGLAGRGGYAGGFSLLYEKANGLHLLSIDQLSGTNGKPGRGGNGGYGGRSISCSTRFIPKGYNGQNGSTGTLLYISTPNPYRIITQVTDVGSAFTKPPPSPDNKEVIPDAAEIDLTGRWKGENPILETSLTLNTDRSFVLKIANNLFPGSYEIKGDQLKLTWNETSVESYTSFRILSATQLQNISTIASLNIRWNKQR